MLRPRTWGCSQTKCYCRWHWLWVQGGSKHAGGEPGPSCAEEDWYRDGAVGRERQAHSTRYHGLEVGTGGGVLGNMRSTMGIETRVSSRISVYRGSRQTQPTVILCDGWEKIKME